MRRIRIDVVAAAALILAAAPRLQAQTPGPGEPPSGDGGASAEAPAASASPEDVVATLHGALIDAAAAGSGRAERIERLEPVVAATHDLPYIAQLTIRRQWRDLGAAQRDAFVAAFSALSVATYATRFSGAGPDTFEIVSAEDDGAGRIWVHARILPPDAEPVTLDYLLHAAPPEQGGGWKIVNILADGVSDLALKRAEYQRILADGTIDDLVAALREQADAD